MITEDKIIETLKQFEQQDYKRGGVSIDPSNYNAIAQEVVKNCSIPHVSGSLPLSEVKKMAEEMYEGCDGCDGFDQQMYVNGFVAGYYSGNER